MYPLGIISACDSRRYPTASEVGKLAAELNPERTASYFAEVVKRICRETEEIAHAYCPHRPNGERHVYYLEGLPDPDDARWVKVGSQERDPEQEETEPKLMTDGGTLRSEAKQDLERIRKARDGEVDSTDSPETFTCPIEGCSRIVIGSLTLSGVMSGNPERRGIAIEGWMTRLKSNLMRRHITRRGAQDSLRRAMSGKNRYMPTTKGTGSRVSQRRIG
ncbi:hypothetical protein ACFQL4_04105 [Halosimplex aquaticum]